MAGWIKLYRKLLDNPIVMKDGDHLAIWTYLLLNAQHENYRTIFGGKSITLKPGQLITGRKKIARDLKISESKTRRVLNALKSEHQIGQQAERYGSLITILSWNEYQKGGQQNSQQMTNERPTSGQRPTTIQEGEECKEGGEKFTPPSAASVFSFFESNNFVSDPEQFYSWYEDNGWTKKNGDPVKDWKSLARQWEKREKRYKEERTAKGASKVPVQQEPPKYPEFEPEPDTKAVPPDPEQRRRLEETKRKMMEAIT